MTLLRLLLLLLLAPIYPIRFTLAQTEQPTRSAQLDKPKTHEDSLRRTLKQQDITDATRLKTLHKLGNKLGEEGSPESQQVLD